ncbi:MAG TPA: hypothetical protein VGV59_16235 [Pyrinomonadaceae bacterium]|nr:hypothetical protein [Pyrinomonadaceae bacterium]
MNSSLETRRRRAFSDERGGARLSFIITIVVIGLVAYSAYQYIPVAYHAYLFKDTMQEVVNIGAGSGRDTDWVRNRLRESADENDIPKDAVIDVQTREGRVEARVRWVRNIPLPGYTYQYDFDHTVTSSSFLAPR